MSRTGVITDSTIDLTERAAQVGVEIVPLVVNWDGETLRDRVDISTEAFYQRLRGSKSMPKTGAPSIGAYQDAFRRGLARHESLICVTISSALSATFEVARQAAETLEPDRIHVFDSRSVTIAAGWIVERAAEMGAAGKAPAEIQPQMESVRERIRAYAILDTLEFLQRGGRIGRAAAIAGTLLSVKPIILIKDGEVHPVERVRTVAGATRRVVEIVAGLAPIERIAVMHGDAAKNAEVLGQQLQSHVSGVQIEHGEISSVIGVHGGPGLFGAALLVARPG